MDDAEASAAECHSGLRGRRPPPELHPRRGGTRHDSGCSELPDQAAGGPAGRASLYSDAPAGPPHALGEAPGAGRHGSLRGDANGFRGHGWRRRQRPVPDGASDPRVALARRAHRALPGRPSSSGREARHLARHGGFPARGLRHRDSQRARQLARPGGPQAPSEQVHSGLQPDSARGKRASLAGGSPEPAAHRHARCVVATVVRGRGPPGCESVRPFRLHIPDPAIRGDCRHGGTGSSQW